MFAGFLAGLFAFRVKSRWCPLHGVVLRCPDCRMGLPTLTGDGR